MWRPEAFRYLRPEAFSYLHPEAFRRLRPEAFVRCRFCLLVFVVSPLQPLQIFTVRDPGRAPNKVVGSLIENRIG